MTVVVIAACARPFVVAAARAGHTVAALDIFNDVETRRCCFHSAQISFCHGGFVAEDLLQQLAHPALTGATVVYGSGLETQPQLLTDISQRFSVLGNDADTVAFIKNPQCFFPLLDRLAIPYPQTRWQPPANFSGWLEKTVGGSGGTHIREAASASAGYYQRRLAGIPVSVLFLADGRDASMIGYNEQWLAPTPGMPFRYGGAVGHASLPSTAATAMADAVCKLVDATGLRGLNSMDFMLELEDEHVFALEVNPRLSASFDLYEIPELFDWHMQACSGRMPKTGELPSSSKAHLIYYATRDMEVNQHSWPDWVADIPPAGTLCRAGEPVCSIHAIANDVEQARILAFARARQLEAQLQSL